MVYPTKLSARHVCESVCTLDLAPMAAGQIRGTRSRPASGGPQLFLGVLLATLMWILRPLWPP